MAFEQSPVDAKELCAILVGLQDRGHYEVAVVQVESRVSVLDLLRVAAFLVHDVI